MTGRTSINDDIASIMIEPIEDGKRQITISPNSTGTYLHRRNCITSYDDKTIRAILAAKGSSYLCDEISRDEDPDYIRPHVILTVTAHLDPGTLAGKRIMDFGCGCGASTVALAQLLPETRICGVELESRNLDAASARAEFYRLDNITFMQSPDADKLHDKIGMFDVIMLPAVYEHLLPEERKSLLPRLWSHLVPGGMLLIDETPWRWFPVETHTTGLFLINYLPDKIALWFARKFSRRVDKAMTWPVLLRRGIRGGTIREILKNIGSPAFVVKPSREGINSHVDLWHRGYVSRSRLQAGMPQRMVVAVLAIIERITGLAAVPYLSIAIRKPG